jgi:hypothetical protein
MMDISREEAAVITAAVISAIAKPPGEPKVEVKEEIPLLEFKKIGSDVELSLKKIDALSLKIEKLAMELHLLKNAVEGKEIKEEKALPFRTKWVTRVQSSWSLSGRYRQMRRRI